MKMKSISMIWNGLSELVEKAVQYKIALKNISDILEGQNVTELIER